MKPKITVEFMVLTAEADVAHGVVAGCESVEAMRKKLEDMGCAIIHIAEANTEEAAEAEAFDIPPLGEE